MRLKKQIPESIKYSHQSKKERTPCTPSIPESIRAETRKKKRDPINPHNKVDKNVIKYFPMRKRRKERRHDMTQGQLMMMTKQKEREKKEKERRITPPSTKENKKNR